MPLVELLDVRQMPGLGDRSEAKSQRSSRRTTSLQSSISIVSVLMLANCRQRAPDR